MKKTSLSLFILLFIAIGTHAQSNIVKGYYMYWSKGSLAPSTLPWDDLTHVSNAFIWPKTDGTLVTSQAYHPELIAEAHKNNVKVIISVGGWGYSDAFPTVVADSSLRAKLITNLTDYVVQNEYDGIDLDWEYPTASDRNNVTKFITELHASFQDVNPDLTISIAMPSVDWQNGYNYSAIMDYVEWFGLMTYDFHGSWTERGGHNSPLFAPQNSSCNNGSISQSVQSYRQKGVPSEKMVVGLASYGRSFNTSVICGIASSGSNNGASVSYADAMQKIDNGWTYHWDDSAKAPWLQNANSTKIVSFDDTTSFRMKREYIQSKNLKGAMVWALGYDKTPAGHELMNVLGDLKRMNTSTEKEGPENIPQDFVLKPNYPNPFNPVTTISYSLGKPGRVKLQVFNGVGQLIQEVVNTEQSAGTYSVQFDGMKLSSGIYIYRLTVNGHSKIQKMTLLK